MTKAQRQVVLRAVKYKHRKARRDLASHLNWYRKNKKPIEF